MITAEKIISLPDTYPLERLGAREQLLFFDIETTGFSGERDRVYLIGCVYFRGGLWRLIQWFADREDSEPELLAAFSGFLRPFSVLVHFNGDSFDIPFLQKRCGACGLALDLSGTVSVDIYKQIRPYRSLLRLEDLKQKSVERFLGVCREDPFTGGQLIRVYEDYLVSRRDRLLDILMRHNREDLEGMPRILPILCYRDFLEGEFRLERQEIRKPPDEEGQWLSLRLKSPCRVPVPVSREGRRCGQRFCARAEEERLSVTLELLEGELKHFYPDYRNYYYLICEDMAVHKSVGEFVERSARRKATAQTCYTKKEGLYLPQAEPLWEPVFKRDYRDRGLFVPYEPELLADGRKRDLYLKGLLTG